MAKQITPKQTPNVVLIFNKYAKTSSDRYALVREAQKGIPARTVNDLILITNNKKDFFADLLHISVKTLDRYTKENKNFSPTNSEQVLKYFSLYEKSTELFGSIESFNRWLQMPNYGLFWEKPIDLMQTAGGVDLVMEELIRIEFGDLA
jgi:putative toxin-antitoxin system antitoxin component (TIGR02293 family)